MDLITELARFGYPSDLPRSDRGVAGGRGKSRVGTKFGRITDEQVAVMVDAAWPDEATALRVLAAFVYVQRQREQHRIFAGPLGWYSPP